MTTEIDESIEKPVSSSNFHFVKWRPTYVDI